MNQTLRILLVEDNEDDADLLSRELQMGGYHISTQRVQTAAEMKAALETKLWDVIIADYTLPQLSAMKALEILHHYQLDLPFIIVSGTIGEEAAVSALKAGAHDFIAKGKWARLGPAIERELREAGNRRQRKEADQVLRRRASELFVLQTVSKAAMEAIDKDDFIERSMQVIDESLFPDQFGYMILDPVDQYLRMHRSYRGVSPENIVLPIHIGEGITGRVAASGQPMRISDVSREPGYIRYNPNIRSELCVPVKLGDRVIGVLNTESSRTEAFTDLDEHLLMTLAGQLATGIYRLQTEDVERQQARQLTTIYEISQEILGASLEPEQVYLAIHRTVGKLMPNEAFVIAQLNKDRQVIEGVYMVDKSGRSPKVQIPLGEGLSGLVIGTGQMVLIDDFLEGNTNLNAVPFGSGEQVRSILAVPMRLNGKIIGMLSTQSYQVQAYTQDNMRLLELLSAYAAIALENARLFKETRRQALAFENMFDSIIMASLDGTILDWNPAAEAMFGYKRSEVIGKSVTLIHRPENIPALEIEINTTVQREGRWKNEMIFVRKDGSQGTSDVVVVPLHDENGEIVATVGVNRDITQRKLAEEARDIQEHKRKEAEQAILRRASQLEALNMAAIQIQKHLEPQNIFEAACNELQQFGTFATSFLVSDADHLQHVFTSMDAELEQAIQPLLAHQYPHQGLIPIAPFYPHWKRLVAGETILSHQFASKFQQAIPDEFRPLIAWVDQKIQHGSIILAPLMVSGSPTGVLGLLGKNLGEQDLPAITLLARNVSVALENARLLQETRQRANEMEIIAQVSQSLRVARTRMEMLPLILDQLMKLFSGTAALIGILDPATGEIIYELGRGEWKSLTGLHLAQSEDLCGQVIISGQPYVINNQQKIALNDRHDLTGKAVSVCCTPLVVQGQTMGALVLGRETPFGSLEIRIITAISDMSASAIHRTTLHEQTEQRLQRLSALHTIDAAISTSMDLRYTLNVLLEQVNSQLKVDAADILLLNAHTHLLEFAAGRGFRTNAIASSRVRLDEGLAGRIAIDRRNISFSDFKENTPGFTRSLLLAGEAFVGYYAVPLIVKGQVKGVLEIYHRSPLITDPESIGFLDTLASQAAIAIDNAELFVNLQRSNLELSLAYDSTIEGWSHALDLRDHETEGHTQRVTEMTIKLASKMGLSDEQLVHIRRGALLHDIGKMGIPDNILLKPAQLTPEEQVIMRKHPVYAYDLLVPIPFLRPALDIPYCHHEKWNGGGYPRGLKGDQIPLSARLFAVVDVWDALLTDRPYRPAWHYDEVVKFIRNQTGLHFDPQAVKAFFEIIPLRKTGSLRPR